LHSIALQQSSIAFLIVTLKRPQGNATPKAGLDQ
jgi:hypothetical protein